MIVSTGSTSRRSLLAAVGASAAALALPRVAHAMSDGEAAARLPTAEDVEATLREKILAAWYPRCINGSGGFHQQFAEDWTRLDDGPKFLVYQARQTWTAAVAAATRPDLRRPYLRYALHGMKYLAGPMWDADRGGYVDWTDDEGRPQLPNAAWKQMYAQSFGLYATAAVVAAARAAGLASEAEAALTLAKTAFAWFEQHAHDAECGGYFEHLTAEGRPVAVCPADAPEGVRVPVIGRVGHKSMNAHIHLLEALTELRRVWDDALLRCRLEEVFLLVRDKIVRPEGHLAIYCDREFTPTEEASSFGHELETAYLLVEAAELLHRDDDEQTAAAVRTLVDHSIRWGWDAEHGGFFYEGPPRGRPHHRAKIWWTQAEALNGLMTADRLFGGETSRYCDLLARQWDFFYHRQIDHRHGDCFEELAESGEPRVRRKASPWKTSYHVARAVMEMARYAREIDRPPPAGG